MVGLVAATKSVILGRPVVTTSSKDEAKESSPNADGGSETLAKECESGRFACAGADWRILVLQKGHGRVLRGPPSTELRRAYDLWPTHQIVVERIGSSSTTEKSAEGEGEAETETETDGAAPFATVLGDTFKTTSASLPSPPLEGEEPRPTVAEAFEASQNFLHIRYNDPFETGAFETGPNYSHFVAVDGRESIASLRRKIARNLLKLHPERAVKEDTDDGDSGTGTGNGAGATNDGEAEAKEDDDLSKAKGEVVNGWVGGWTESMSGRDK